MQVHNLYGDERKNVLGWVRFSTQYNHNSSLLPARPAHILKEMRCVRKKTSAVLKPTKTIPRVRASLITKPYPEFNFRHKYSLLVVGPTQVEKLTLSNKFWRTIVSCTRSEEVSTFFCATINGKIVTTT
jgi:hypothetical protein